MAYTIQREAITALIFILQNAALDKFRYLYYIQLFKSFKSLKSRYDCHDSMSEELRERQRDTPRLERVFLVAAMIAWGFSFHFYDYNFPMGGTGEQNYNKHKYTTRVEVAALFGHCSTLSCVQTQA